MGLFYLSSALLRAGQPHDQRVGNAGSERKSCAAERSKAGLGRAGLPCAAARSKAGPGCAGRPCDAARVSA